MGELQTVSRQDIARTLAPLTMPPPRRSRRRRPATDHPPRPTPRARPVGPLCDIDMGIGRHLGYRDPRRLATIVVRAHPAVPEVADAGWVGAEMLRVRAEAGVTKRAVAVVLDVHEQQIVAWERGQRVAPSYIRAWWDAACLRASRTRILGRS